MIQTLLPLLDGWRWIWDYRPVAYTVPAGTAFDLVPKKSGCGLGLYGVATMNQKYSNIVWENDDMKFYFSPFLARAVSGMDEPQANVGFCTKYDSMNEVYSMVYAPSYWPPWKRYIRVYIQAAGRDLITGIPITTPTNVILSLIVYVEIEDPELFEASLRRVLGTKEELTKAVRL